MADSELSTVKARWDLSGEGPDEPRRRMLIDLAFRLAAAVQPGFGASRDRREISSNSEVDEMWGGFQSTEVYRLGAEEHGAQITERVMDPQDGMTPFETSTEVKIYGLPDGWSLTLSGYFTPPVRGKPQSMYMEACLPGPAVRDVAALLRHAVGAEVEVS